MSGGNFNFLGQRLWQRRSKLPNCGMALSFPVMRLLTVKQMELNSQPVSQKYCSPSTKKLRIVVLLVNLLLAKDWSLTATLMENKRKSPH